MFEENYTGISFYDIGTYFLAQEMKKSQIIGMDFDFASLDDNAKVQVKLESYDYFRDNNILEMDFSGESSVSKMYSDMVSALESPDYCAVVQYADNRNGNTYKRKVYLNNSVWTAFDYFNESHFDIYTFDNDLQANKFAFIGIDITESSHEEEKVHDLERLFNESDDVVIITEYSKDSGKYNVSVSVYVNKNGVWSVLNDIDEITVKSSVSKPVQLRLKGE